jgi:hypothetical protein
MKDKGIGILIGLKPKKDADESEGKLGSSSDSGGLERKLAAKKLLAAIEASDPSALAKAFETMMSCCGETDDDEDDEDEGDEKSYRHY